MGAVGIWFHVVTLPPIILTELVLEVFISGEVIVDGLGLLRLANNKIIGVTERHITRSMTPITQDGSYGHMISP